MIEFNILLGGALAGFFIFNTPHIRRTISDPSSLARDGIAGELARGRT